MNETGWYGKVAYCGSLSLRRRNPVIIFCESIALAEKFFIDYAKTLPGPLGLGGHCPGKLYRFPTKEAAETFFRNEKCGNIIFEQYKVFKE